MWASLPRRELALWAVKRIGGVVAAGAALFFLLGCGSSDSPAPIVKCNGSASLCDRPLNDVAFAATHNSYAGADVPGWHFPEQEVGISEQLKDGIRGLWIDAYYGIPGKSVYTDTSKIDPALHAELSKQLGPKLTAAADQIRRRISKPKDEAPRIYLCHGYCELGAVDGLDAMSDIKGFLDQNPDEVLIIDIEDYVEPKDMVDLLEKSGLAAYAYRGPIGPPWPTLQQMINRGQRVLIMAEHRTGAADWYFPAYRLFQETPFSFHRPSQMSCDPNRGKPSNSLFLINNWISTDPKPLPVNAKIVNNYAFLLHRARQCEKQRGLLPNVIAVDFYREGNLSKVIGTLNKRRANP